MRRLLATVGSAAFFLAPAAAMAQVAVPMGGVTIDFTGFTGAGFQPSPSAGQLDSDDWAIIGFSDGTLNFGGTMTTGDYARGSSTGGVTTPGIYGFLDGADPMFGIQPGNSDATPGALTLRVSNNTAQTLSGFQISYNVFVLNNDGRSSSVDFSYSNDDISYTGLPSLKVTSGQAADVSPAWAATAVSTPIAISLAPAGVAYLRWATNDVAGGGGRDELGIDDIVIAPVVAVIGPDGGTGSDAGTIPSDGGDAAATGSTGSNTDASVSMDGGALADGSAAPQGGAGGVGGMGNAGTAGAPQGGANPAGAGNGGSAGNAAGSTGVGGIGDDAGGLGSDAGAPGLTGGAAGDDGACGCTAVGIPTKSHWSLIAIGLFSAMLVRRRRA
jgi:hypothetical protein